MIRDNGDLKQFITPYDREEIVDEEEEVEEFRSGDSVSANVAKERPKRTTLPDIV